jgi:DMSO/TMAO reductase YedYZ heme-binding membrane subunit
MTNDLWWYVTRSAGFVAWIFLVATLVWGMLVAGRLAPAGRARRWLTEMHPYLAGVGLGALVLHVVAAVADTTVGLGWVNTVVPLTAPWQPGAIAWGVIAVWSLAAVEITSLARRRLGRRTWRRVHLMSYAAAGTMTLHAVTAGTDVGNPIVQFVLVAGTAVAAMVAAARRLHAAPVVPVASSRIIARQTGRFPTHSQ